MDVTPLINSDHQIIQSYADGKFRVSGTVYEGAIIVRPSCTVMWEKSADSVQNLIINDFQQLIDISDEIDVVLLGGGASAAFLDFALKKALSGKGISVDVMGSGAACRTYNVLMTEGRRVAALLFPA